MPVRNVEPLHTEPAPTAPVPQQIHERQHPRSRDGLAPLLAAPAALLLVTFVFVPLALTLVLSFFHWDLASPDKHFDGLANFRYLLHSSDFSKALLNTTLYAALFMVVVIPVGLVLAFLVNHELPAIKTLRAFLFLPYVLPLVGAAIAWQFLFVGRYGLIDVVLGYLDVTGPNWLAGKWTALFAITIVFIWENIGFYMLIFLGGLQSLDPALGEAASLDGATGRQRLWRIELPQMRSIMLLAVVFAIIQAFQLFDQIFVMTGGGPGTATMSLVYYIYAQGFQFFQEGHAAAASLVLLIILVLVTAASFHVFRDRGDTTRKVR